MTLDVSDLIRNHYEDALSEHTSVEHKVRVLELKVTGLHTLLLNLEEELRYRKITDKLSKLISEYKEDTESVNTPTPKKETLASLLKEDKPTF